MTQDIAGATTKSLYPVIPVTAMSFQRNDGLWECVVLDMPRTGALGLTQQEAEQKAQYAACVTCLYISASYEATSSIWDQASGVDNESE